MISFLSRPPCLSYVISLVAPWKLLPWMRVLSRCILMHSCVVKIVFIMLVFTRLFAILIGIPRLDEAFAFYLHHGLSQCWLFFLHFSVLVNPFAWCVWGGHVMHLVSHLFKTMLMLKLILILVFSSALPWLTHLILVEPTLKLPLLYVAQPFVCWKC